MSLATDAKVKELDARVRDLETLCAALKVKLEAVETLTIPRPKRIPREKNDNSASTSARDSQWAQQTTP